MSKSDVLVCNFSGVYEEEGFFHALQECGLRYSELDFREMEGTECYCDPEAEAMISEAVSGREELVRWIDSGDYHYMSKLLAGRITEPFTLVLLDNHPDDQVPGFGEILSCGGWVRDLRRDSKALERVLTVGPDGAFGKDFPSQLPKRLYISLDKDVMGRDYARTNWNQGSMTLEKLKEILRMLLGSGAEILGVDICGELTASKGAKAEDYRINLKTNIELQKLVTTYLN